jgi:hypothetical protein
VERICSSFFRMGPICSVFGCFLILRVESFHSMFGWRVESFHFILLDHPEREREMSVRENGSASFHRIHHFFWNQMVLNLRGIFFILGWLRSPLTNQTYQRMR